MRHKTFATRKLILSGLLGIVSVGAFATTGFAKEPQSIQRMSRSTLHEQIGRAIQTNDYEAFVTAIAGQPGSQALTKGEFNALVQANVLRQAGNYKEAQQVLQKVLS